MLWHGFFTTLIAICLLSKHVSAASSNNARDLGSQWSSIVSKAKSEVSSLCTKFIGTKTTYVTATVTDVSTSTASITVINTGFSTDTLLATTVIDETTVLLSTTVLTSTSFSTTTSVAVVPATYETDTTTTLLLTTLSTATSYNTAVTTTTIPEVDTVDVTSTVYTTPISTSIIVSTQSVTETIPFVTTTTKNVCGTTDISTITITATNPPSKKIRRALDHPQHLARKESMNVDTEKRDLISDAFNMLGALDSSFVSSECSKLITPPATVNTRTTTALATTLITTTIAGSTEVVGSITSIIDNFSTDTETTTITITTTVESVVLVVPTSTSYTDVTSTFESTSTVTSVATLASEVVVVVTATSTEDVFSTAISTGVVPSTTVIENTSIVSFTTTLTSTSTVSSTTACSSTTTKYVCVPSNLVKNPGFESGNISPYFNHPEGQSTGEVVLDPADAHSGSYAYQATIPAQPNGYDGSYEELEILDVSVFAETGYTFTMFVKAPTISGSTRATCTMDILVSGADDNVIAEDEEPYFTDDSGEMEINFKFNTGTSTSIDISISLTCSGTTTASTFYYDDLSLLCS